MAFKDLVGKAQELTNTAAEGAAKLLDEFNEALPTMRALGFTIKDFQMGMGLIPEVTIILVASVDTVNVGRISELITQYSEKKLLVALLKALQAAYHVKEQLGDKFFKSVETDVTLGLPPRIGVKFGSSAPAGEVAAQAAHA